MIYAPFIVPTLCRSEHFIRMIESLKRNSWACYTDVIVSVDYPPLDKYRKGWEEICTYLDTGDFSVFNQMIVIKQPENLGPGKNGYFLEQYVNQRYDRWIRCDDDCEFSPNFLEYMDKCLDAFEDDEDVIVVTGYSYPIGWTVSEGATCMKQQFNAATWGLGYWKGKHSALSEYIKSGKMLDDARMVIRTGRWRKMISKCYAHYINRASTSRSGTYSFMTKVTDLSLRASLACQDKYCVSPIISKVRNTGFDGSGVYCKSIVNADNTTAGTYDYTNQPFDTSNHFDIVLNDSSQLEQNRLKLDKFDKISNSLLLFTHLKAFIIRFFGVGFARGLDHALVSILKLVGVKK